MRWVLPICFLFFISYSCVKAPNEDPVPTLEYEAVQGMARYVNPGAPGTPAYIRDSATLVLKYADGDGDIFRNSTSDPANLIWFTYAFSPDSNKFVVDQGPNTQVIIQPANGYYKDKAIHGEMYIPMKAFRSSTNVKIVRFEAFVVDMKDHKSNVVVTPTFTLNF